MGNYPEIDVCRIDLPTCPLRLRWALETLKLRPRSRTNSCSRRHERIVLFILICCNRASPPQFIGTAFHAYNSSKKTNNSYCSSGCSGYSSCSGLLRLLLLLELLWAPSAAPAPGAVLGSFGCSGSSSCSGPLWLCALLLLHALTI
jgi:hypothetical protein